MPGPRYLFNRYRRRSRLRHPDMSLEDNSIKLDMESDSRTLLLAFGGLNRVIGIPPFEFLSLTGELPVKRMFVRDRRQAWYHRGIPQHGETLDEVTESLRRLIASHGVERLVVAGNSAGGYAALLLGTLLEADTVLSFAPQTTIDMPTLKEMGDHRWDDHLRALTPDERWVDLAAALPRLRRADTRYQVYFDESLAQDRRHAERLIGLAGLRLYRFGRGSHYLVRALRDCGALERILIRSLQPLAVTEEGPRAEHPVSPPSSL
jgi:pimeloyl-ACP methyl ester carboxylesterase